MLRRNKLLKVNLKCQTRESWSKHSFPNCHAGTKQSQEQYKVVTTFMFCYGPPSP